MASAKFHTSFCIQWMAESSDSSSIEDPSVSTVSVTYSSNEWHLQGILPWKVDFDVRLLLLRLELLLFIAELLRCCREVCDGFWVKEYVSWRLICRLNWSFSRGTVTRNYWSTEVKKWMTSILWNVKISAETEREWKVFHSFSTLIHFIHKNRWSILDYHLETSTHRQ